MVLGRFADEGDNGFIIGDRHLLVDDSGPPLPSYVELDEVKGLIVDRAGGEQSFDAVRPLAE